VIPKDPQAMAQRLNLHSLQFKTGYARNAQPGPGGQRLRADLPEARRALAARCGRCTTSQAEPGRLGDDGRVGAVGVGVWADIDEFDIIDGARARPRERRGEARLPAAARGDPPAGRLYTNPATASRTWLVLDPFMGVGSTAAVCVELGRNVVGFELKECGPDLEWAVDYFVVAWMTRHATAGTPAEFTGGTSARWGATGGDSAAHFHGAVRELPAWRRVFRRCNFTTLDAFEFLDEVFAAEQRDWGKPQQNHTQRGIYADPPFPGPGDRYTHAFGEAGQRRLATSVRRFRFTRCVLRFYDHPLVRELYPEGPWTWVRREGKRQTNDVGPEVLLINGRSITAAAAIRGEL
jgi:hypothetical protein